jgi:glycerol-3-phosphate cytidylyltransferase
MRDLIIGFTCGSFDLCHYGHVLMFEEIRKQCDFLIVGVQSDPTIDRKDKNKPIQSMEERVGQVKAIKYVDRVITYETEDDLYKFLKIYTPDVRFLGADWKGKKFTGHDLIIRNVFNTRDHSYSSSELRQRICDSMKS